MTAVGIDVGKTALDMAIFGEPKVHRFRTRRPESAG
jgi:hypothetical protein